MLYRMTATDFYYSLPDNMVYYSFQGINHMYIGSFRGGQNPTWRLNASQAVFYDDIHVSEEKPHYCTNYVGPCEIDVQGRPKCWRVRWFLVAVWWHRLHWRNMLQGCL